MLSAFLIPKERTVSNEESEVVNMIVKAIWEFDVDDSEMDGKCVDIKGLCEDLTRRELDYCLKHNQLNADDFQYCLLYTSPSPRDCS